MTSRFSVLIGILFTTLALACAGNLSCDENAAPVVTTAVRDGRHVTITVRNVENRAICIGVSDWPTPDRINGDVFEVRGQFASKWAFTGFNYYPSAKPMRVEPGQTVQTGEVDLTRFYKSDVASDKIVAASWEVGFLYCDCVRQ